MPAPDVFGASIDFVHWNSLHLLHRKGLTVSYNYFPGGLRWPSTEQITLLILARLESRITIVDRLLNAPGLQTLQQGDPEAWEQAFRWLWPTAFAVAQLKLQPFFPEDIEDVTIEALEALVEKVHKVKAVEELKPLAAGIAHHKSVSLLRERFAKKRGEGKTSPLEPPAGEEGNPHEPASLDTPLAALEEKELADRLRKALSELTPPQGDRKSVV